MVWGGATTACASGERDWLYSAAAIRSIAGWKRPPLPPLPALPVCESTDDAKEPQLLGRELPDSEQLAVSRAVSQPPSATPREKGSAARDATPGAVEPATATSRSKSTSSPDLMRRSTLACAARLRSSPAGHAARR